MRTNERTIERKQQQKIYEGHCCPLNNVYAFELMDLYLICLKNPRNTRKTKKDLVIGALI